MELLTVKAPAIFDAILDNPRLLATTARLADSRQNSTAGAQHPRAGSPSASVPSSCFLYCASPLLFRSASEFCLCLLLNYGFRSLLPHGSTLRSAEELYLLRGGPLTLARFAGRACRAYLGWLRQMQVSNQ